MNSFMTSMYMKKKGLGTNSAHSQPASPHHYHSTAPPTSRSLPASPRHPGASSPRHPGASSPRHHGVSSPHHPGAASPSRDPPTYFIDRIGSKTPKSTPLVKKSSMYTLNLLRKFLNLIKINNQLNRITIMNPRVHLIIHYSICERVRAQFTRENKLT